MTVFARDGFTYSAPATSGSAYFTTTDNTKGRCIGGFFGTPTTGDAFAYTLTFATGTLTIRARWTSSTTLIIERISTIPGTNTGTATLRTFTGTSTSKPRATGDEVRIAITVNRGAVNGVTAISAGWHGRASGSLSSEQTTDTFNVDGELTPSAGAYVVTGTSFYIRPDLEGRTPDGDGDGGLAVGTYHQAEGFIYETDKSVSKEDVVGVDSDGVCRPQVGNFDDCFYLLQGIPGLTDDQVARLYCSVPSTSFVILWVVVRSTFSTIVQPTGSNADGYALLGIAFGDGSIELDILDIGTRTFLDGVSVNTADNTPHSYSIQAVGDQISILVDDIIVLTVTDGTYTTGDPGFGAVPSDDGVPGIDILGFEVDTPAEAVDTCQFLVSHHEFYGPARADINNQPTDEFPGIGVLVKHPSSGAVIAEDASEGWVVGAGRAVYLDEEIEGQFAGDPVPLGDDYCVYLVGRFPRLDSVTVTSRTVIWEDDLTSLALGEPLDGRTHNGGTAGTGTYELELTGDPDIDAGAEVVGDGDGRAMQPADPTSPRLSTNRLVYRISGLTLPQDYDVEADVYNSAQAYGKIGVVVRMGVGPDNGMAWNVNQLAGVGPWDNNYHAQAGGQPTGALTTINKIGPAGSTKEFETRIRGTNPAYATVYFGGVAYVADGVAEISFYDGQFTGVQGHFDDGDIGMLWEEDGAGAVNPLRLSALRIFEYVTTSTPALERADAEVLVRYDELVDSGFGLRLNFDHTDTDIVATAYIFERDFGVETRCTPIWDVGVSHDTGFDMLLTVSGTLLTARVGVAILGTFDYALDAADETAAPVTAHDTGDPGLGGSDDSGVGAFMRLMTYEVFSPGVDDDGNPCVTGDCNPVDPPCDGPGEPPGGGYPPGPPPEIPVGYWVRRNLAWRFVLLPTIALPSTDTGVRRNLARRELVTLTGTPPEPFGVRQNLAWRYPFFDYGVGDPPGDGPYPPNYDPCEQLPPTEDPPDVIVGAPPDRLFFTWAIGASQLGPLWTATFRAMGGSILGEISQAAARGGAIFGTPGDKHKFFRNGYYASDLMDAWIRSLAPLAPTVMAAQAAGSFAGVHAADDWENPMLWPPSGLPLTEINRIAAVWKAVFDPGLRVMLRARTGQIGSTPLPNIDGIISQMRMTGTEWEAAGRTARGYAEKELDFCQNRGWILHLSQNFYNGLQVRQPMTAFQVLDNAIQWLDVTASHPHGGAVYGMGGWEFNGIVTGPAYLNAYGTWRNGLAALGPPTFP